MTFLEILRAHTKHLIQIFLICGCLLSVERLNPIYSAQPRRAIFFNLKWIVVNSILLFFFGIVLFNEGLDNLANVLQSIVGGPYIKITLPDSWLGYTAGWLIITLITDFFTYWTHRLQHTSLLWSQHKLHHSDRSVNVTTYFRHHWSEFILSRFFIILPIQAIFNIQPFFHIEIYLLGNVLWSCFCHMNIKVQYGFWSFLISGPQYHWIHHSRREEHFDKNFAVYFPLWDILFGTYFHPRLNEFPETGLPHGEKIDTLWQAVWLPFNELSQQLAHLPLLKRLKPTSPSQRSAVAIKEKTMSKK
jgi:sterol desaturase/sphingolipid hydroxylase (fatty acid hydroxylase superfamily)